MRQENEKYAGEARSRLQLNRLLLSAHGPRVAQLIMYCSSEYCILFEFYHFCFFFLAAFNKKGCKLVLFQLDKYLV